MTAKLRLCVKSKKGKSVLEDSYFTSPLKLGVPVCRKDRLDIIVMMASAGVLKNDTFSYEMICEPETKTRITEQSYTKIFDTGDGKAEKKQYIRLYKNASLYNHPSAVIPFKNSTFDSEINVDLDGDSEFAWSDILSGGRIAMGEKFAFKHYRNRICVCIDGVPAWIDHCLLEPDRMGIESMCFFAGYTHQGTFYYYGNPEKQKRILEWNIQIQEESKIYTVGATQARAGICVRVLANSAQDIEELFANLAKLLEME